MSKDFWFNSCLGQEVYLYSKLSTPALGPTQLHFQWVLGIVSSGEKCWECEAEHLSLLLRLRMNRAVPPLPHMPSWRRQGLYPFLNFILVVHDDEIAGSTALQVGRSRVRFPMGSWGFSIDLILLAAPEPSGPLSLLRKWDTMICPGG
jgi:hypothetical protein